MFVIKVCEAYYIKSLTMKQNRRINPDLIKERQSCNFKTLELTYLLDGGKEKTDDRKWRGIIVYTCININVLKFLF